MKSQDKNHLNQKVKDYKSQLKQLVDEFYWVDETLATEYDLKIHSLAKRIVNARKSLDLAK